MTPGRSCTPAGNCRACPPFPDATGRRRVKLIAMTTLPCEPERPGRPGSARPVLIEADDRESRSQVVAILRSLPGVTVCIRHLKVGDYQVAGRCLIERKSVVDLAASIIDGRLFAQAHRLSRAAAAVALLLQGRWEDLGTSAIRREAVQGALVSLSIVFGLPVLRSSDAGETARILLYAGQQLSRAADDHVCVRHGYRPRGEHRRKLYVLQGLPGVGPRRAAQLLARFGSVAAAMNANADELVAVPGLGAATAAQILQVTGTAARRA